MATPSSLNCRSNERMSSNAWRSCFPLTSVPLPAALQPSKTTMTGMPKALTCRWRQPSFMSASSLSLLYSSLATSRDKSMFLSITTRDLNSQALSYNIIEHSRLQSKIEDEDEDDNLA